jgi:hypothetical protein
MDGSRLCVDRLGQGLIGDGHAGSFEARTRSGRHEYGGRKGGGPTNHRAGPVGRHGLPGMVTGPKKNRNKLHVVNPKPNAHTNVATGTKVNSQIR